LNWENAVFVLRKMGKKNCGPKTGKKNNSGAEVSGGAKSEHLQVKKRCSTEKAAK